MEIRDKKVVVTGGAGFIGSNLVRELAGSNDVTVIDNLITGRRENISGVEGVSLVMGSVTNLKLLQKVFEDVDYVFHEAALPSVLRSVENPLESNDANINGTVNVLVAARDNKVGKVVYASSSSVYGDTPTLPKIETMKPMPQSPYAVTKLVGEYYCKVFYGIYGLKTVSLRYFNVYGPNQDPNSGYAAVIPNFISRILRDEPPVIYGDGMQTRDFTYVRDVVQANILAALSEKANGEVINIACGVRTSVNDLLREVKEIFGGKQKPEYAGPREGDVRHSLADISKARELLGHKPRYDLERGLLEMKKTGVLY